MGLILPLAVKAQVMVHQQDFSSGLSPWQAVDFTDPTDQWNVSGGYAQINGYSGSDDEDWLISPSLDLDAQAEEYLLFDYHDNYNGGLLELLYSIDYNGSASMAAINSSTWTAIPLELIDIYDRSCQSSLYQRHPAIDISGISGSSVYFAFRYAGSSSLAKHYKLDNIEIQSGYYEQIESSILNGNYCSGLKTELRNLIAVQSDRIRYSSSLYDTWDAFLHTDNRLNDAGSETIVWDMFTDYPSNSGETELNHCLDRDDGSCSGGEGVCYNREHSLPRSWWGGGSNLADTQYVDLHHLVPSDKYLNTAKSNYPPGEVLIATITGSNGFKVGFNASYPCGSTRYFEPIDEYKGDYARMYMYLATRYEHAIDDWETLNTYGDCALDGNSYSVYEPWLRYILSKWHHDDPVSQKEIDRNNAVYAIQGNRNPFIDHPEYATLIWDDFQGNPCGFSPLPIELLSFEAKWNSDGVYLDWSTASEIDNSHFIVERSKDGVQWSSVLELAGAGNSSSQLSYNVVDRFPMTGVSYYRLRQVDFSGSYSFSPIRVVVSPRTYVTKLSAYPSPTTGILYLEGIEQESELPIRLQIMGLDGRDYTALVPISAAGDGRFVLDLSSLSAGTYLLRTADQAIRVLKY